MNLGFSKSNLEYFFHKYTISTYSKMRLDHVNPISQGTTLFSVRLFSPTAVQASLISTRVTRVTRKTESMKSSRNINAYWVWVFKTAKIELRYHLYIQYSECMED